MIVPMKKATLFCLTSDRESVLEKLREMGFMHFQFEQRGDTQEQSNARHILADIEKVSAILSEIKVAPAAQKVDFTDGQQIVSETLQLLDEKQSVAKESAERQNTLEIIKPWGDFSEASLKALEDKGI